MARSAVSRGTAPSWSGGSRPAGTGYGTPTASSSSGPISQSTSTPIGPGTGGIPSGPDVTPPHATEWRGQVISGQITPYSQTVAQSAAQYRAAEPTSQLTQQYQAMQKQQDYAAHQYYRGQQIAAGIITPQGITRTTSTPTVAQLGPLDLSSMTRRTGYDTTARYNIEPTSRRAEDIFKSGIQVLRERAALPPISSPADIEMVKSRMTRVPSGTTFTPVPKTPPMEITRPTLKPGEYLVTSSGAIITSLGQSGGFKGIKPQWVDLSQFTKEGLKKELSTAKTQPVQFFERNIWLGGLGKAFPTERLQYEEQRLIDYLGSQQKIGVTGSQLPGALVAGAVAIPTAISTLWLKPVSSITGTGRMFFTSKGREEYGQYARSVGPERAAAELLAVTAIPDIPFVRSIPTPIGYAAETIARPYLKSLAERAARGEFTRSIKDVKYGELYMKGGDIGGGTTIQKSEFITKLPLTSTEIKSLSEIKSRYATGLSGEKLGYSDINIRSKMTGPDYTVRLFKTKGGAMESFGTKSDLDLMKTRVTTKEVGIGKQKVTQDFLTGRKTISQEYIPIDKEYGKALSHAERVGTVSATETLTTPKNVLFVPKGEKVFTPAELQTFFGPKEGPTSPSIFIKLSKISESTPISASASDQFILYEKPKPITQKYMIGGKEAGTVTSENLATIKFGNIAKTRGLGADVISQMIKESKVKITKEPSISLMRPTSEGLVSAKSFAVPSQTKVTAAKGIISGTLKPQIFNIYKGTASSIGRAVSGFAESTVKTKPIVPSTAQLSLLKVTPSARVSPAITPAIIPSSKLSDSLKIGQTALVIPSTKSSQATSSNLSLALTPSFTEVPKVSQIVQPAITQVQAPFLRTTQVGQVTTMSIPPVPTIITPIFPGKPGDKIKKTKKVREIIKKKEVGFLLFTRKGGAKQLVTSRILPKGEALALGTRTATRTARASFSIVPTTRRPTSIGIRPLTEQQVYGMGFRPPVKKGRLTSDMTTFIQRRPTRLRDPFEIRDVQSYRRGSSLW